MVRTSMKKIKNPLSQDYRRITSNVSTILDLIAMKIKRENLKKDNLTHF